jgi:RimJ/RimL family protein N-acetyltransferase
MSGPESYHSMQTDRLLMRRWRESDREPFAELNADPETMRSFPATLGRAASDAFIEQLESRFEQLGYGNWALEIAASGQLIGYTGLSPMPVDPGEATGVSARIGRAA